jgi:hypothetical protein
MSDELPPPEFIPQTTFPVERFQLQTTKVCTVCGKERTINRFRAWHGKPHASPRCAACAEKLRLRRRKLIADHRAKEIVNLFAQKVRTAKAAQMPHIADIGSGIIGLLGGLHQFNMKVKEAIDDAKADGKHAVVQNYYLAIAKWAEAAHSGEIEDFSTLNAEELEVIAQEMAKKAITTEMKESIDDADEEDSMILDDGNDDDLDDYVDPATL